MTHLRVFKTTYKECPPQKDWCPIGNLPELRTTRQDSRRTCCFSDISTTTDGFPEYKSCDPALSAGSQRGTVWNSSYINGNCERGLSRSAFCLPLLGNAANLSTAVIEAFACESWHFPAWIKFVLRGACRLPKPGSWLICAEIWVCEREMFGGN